jgi:hypothetical protein
MYRTKITLFFLIIFPFVSLFAQKKNEAFEYHIHRASSPVKIDGLADEQAWQVAETATDFHMVLPMDTSRAKVRTEVKMLYDEKNLYLIAINYEMLPGPYMVESLRRDFNFGKNDNFLLFLDTFDDQNNGFTFGSNAMGAQWDGLLFEGGKANLSWENKWVSAVKHDDDKWVFEMAVPFKTIRYKQGITRWGVNFSRLDLKTTEKSAWAPVPRQFPTASLAYTGNLIWDEPPPAPGTNISIIPYALGGVSKSYEKGTDAAYRRDVGFDAKVAVTSSLNLDLTVNPDFSQVDVDQQQTNLDRFELFFPERRQFFLENGDLFANFGYGTIRPFFSRRIGLNAPIRFGARLSGKLDKNWRIGAMDMQTGKNADGVPGQNFGILALQRQLFARSNISAIFINKETLEYETVADPTKISRYNRNFGFEYNLASSNNVWTGKLLYLHGITPDKANDNQVIAGNLLHTARHWVYGVQYEYVGNNYRAEVGFVPRRGYQSIAPQVGYLFFPKSRLILSHGPLATSVSYFNKNMDYTENESIFSYRINFRSRADLTIWTAYNYVKLLVKFDPTNFLQDSLAVGTTHRWRSFGADFVSKPQSLFTYALSTRYGGFYANGNRFRLAGEAGYRFQPYVAVAMSFNFNRLRFYEDAVLPEGLKNKTYDFWLVGPRIDVTLSNKLFFTNFLQYNNQQKNVNLNVRLQWRYRPASDLFIVYTDNYLSENLAIRNRAIVLKLNYWWNV